MPSLLYTPLCSLLNIELPIIQAPMASAASPALAAAVSNSGGLGMLSTTWRSLEETRQAIHQAREMTDWPFGANLVLEWPQKERLAVCLEEGVRIISFFWGDPSPYIEAVHSVGGLVMHTVASAAEARRAVETGVDVVVAQGWEAGGHVWGKVATFALIPGVADAVSPVPVVAAGGIADGRGIAAALALGASGVWVGTRFLASEEAAIHPLYREKVLQALETDTVYTSLFDVGWTEAPHRTLRNSTIEQWEAAGCPPPGQRPGEGEVIATSASGNPIVRYSDAMPAAGMTGVVEALAMYAGQSVGLVSRLQPAREIIQELVEEAIETIKNLTRLV